MAEPADLAHRATDRRRARAIELHRGRPADFDEHGLETAGCPSSDLAARYDTPLLVVDSDDLGSGAARCAGVPPRALCGEGVHRARAASRRDRGGHRPARLQRRRAAGGAASGIRGERVVFHGNNKSDQELAPAPPMGSGSSSSTTIEEVDRLAREADRAGVVQRVLLRVIPEVEARTHPAIETGAKGSKFGTPPSQAVETAAAIEANPALRLEGIHAHIGSQVLDAGPYLETVDTLLDLLALRDRSGGDGALLESAAVSASPIRARHPCGSPSSLARSRSGCAPEPERGLRSRTWRRTRPIPRREHDGDPVPNGLP